MSMMIRFSTHRSPRPSDEIQGSSGTVEDNLDIVWSGDSWICNKQLTHYPAFCRSGTNIPVYSFVWVMGEEDQDLVGYVEDMYEDQKGEKMVKVRWLNFQEEINIPIPNLNPHSREVFMTPFEQEISAECVDGLAAVLTPNHFEKSLSVLPRSISFGSLMCHREIKNKNVKPFCLSKLRGYSTQPILYTLECLATRQSKNGKNSTHEVEDSAPEEPGMHDSKSIIRNGIVNQTTGNQTPSILGNQGQKCETSHKRVKVKLSSKRPVENNLVASELLGQVPPKVDKNIELLCEDSGMRGCWFRCRILRSAKNCLRVQYHDVDDVDGTRKLEEWVPVARVANPDKLGVRCAGRLTVRPCSEDSSRSMFEVGAVVDARWCDGWWEGIVIGCHPSAVTDLQVYLPGENKFLTIERNKVRVSRDWIENRWVNIKPKTDIFSFLTSTLNPAMNLRPLPVFPKPNTSAVENDSHEAECSETDKCQYPSFSAPVDLKFEKLQFKKRLMIRDDEGKARASSG